MTDNIKAMLKTAIFIGAVLGGYKLYETYKKEKTLDMTRKMKAPTELKLGDWGGEDSILSSITQEDWTGIHG